MKDKINKIRDDAYYQYGFYIGFAIANRIMADTLPPEGFDLRKKENQSKLDRFCNDTLLSCTSLMKLSLSFYERNFKEQLTQLGEIFKIYDLFAFEYLPERKADEKFSLKPIGNFNDGFIAGIDKSINIVFDFYKCFFDMEDLFNSKISEALMGSCYPIIIAMITQERKLLDANLENDASLAPSRKFIKEKENFLRHFKVDRETGFGSLDIDYQCQCPREYCMHKMSGFNGIIKRKTMMLFRFLA